MLCAIHQPNFFPWLGYFEKIARSDVFVFLNQVDYEKSGHSMQCYTNRVAILDEHGKKKNIYCPVIREHGAQKIDTVRIEEGSTWKTEVLSTLDFGYAKAPYKEEIDALMRSIMTFETEFLSEFNIYAIKLICKKLEIETRFVCQDQFAIDKHSTELLVELTKAVGCDQYLYGGGGRKYQEEDVFEREKVLAVQQNFVPWEYKQEDGKEFVPGLSIIDALYWLGIEQTREKLYNRLI